MIPRKSSSLPARGAWIEIIARSKITSIDCVSLPARGAWIEIYKIAQFAAEMGVAPRKGSVD